MADQLAASLALGVAASVVMAFGLLLMKSHAAALPVAQGFKILHAIVRWASDPVWLAGLVLQSAGFTLYLFALADAPVSMLAVMMQGGVAVFVLFAVVFLHERASLSEWVGIAGILVAMLLLTLSLGNEVHADTYNSADLTLLSLAAIGIAAAPFFIRVLRVDGVAAAIASGIVSGLGSLYCKPMTVVWAHTASAGIAILAANPWIYLTIAANIAGLVLLQNSFHCARGVIAMPLSSALSNLVPIAGGVVALGESLPPGTGAAAMRLGAFLLTILASGFLAVSSDHTAVDSLAAQPRMH